MAANRSRTCSLLPCVVPINGSMRTAPMLGRQWRCRLGRSPGSREAFDISVKSIADLSPSHSLANSGVLINLYSFTVAGAASGLRPIGARTDFPFHSLFVTREHPNDMFTSRANCTGRGVGKSSRAGGVARSRTPR